MFPSPFEQVCILSKNGVCILDMRAVLDAAKQRYFIDLVRIIENDLSENKILNGEYSRVIEPIYGPLTQKVSA